MMLSDHLVCHDHNLTANNKRQHLYEQQNCDSLTEPFIHKKKDEHEFNTSKFT